MARQPDLPDPVVKTLFAHSGNLCAFIDIDNGRGCEEKLTDPRWEKVNARIAHIRGRRPGGPRFDSDLANPDIFDNLILLCPLHHTRVDDLEPRKYTVEVLEDMKARGLARAEPFEKWTTEVLLDGYVRQLVIQTQLLRISEQMLDVDGTEEMKQVLADEINRMAEQEKVMLTLYYYEGLTLPEIAQVLGVSEETADARHREAVLQLRASLEGRFEPPEGSGFFKPPE